MSKIGNKKNDTIMSILVVSYTAFLLWLILFKLAFSLEQLPNFKSINVIPFYYSNETSFHLKEIVYNVIAFIPFGVYLKMLDIKGKEIVLYGLCFSTVLESLQYIFSLGSTDITDIITNTIGALLGVTIYALLNTVFKNTNKLNKVLKILALIGTIAVISLVTLVGFVNI